MLPLQLVNILSISVAEFVVTVVGQFISDTKEWACSKSTKEVVSACLSKFKRFILKSPIRYNNIYMLPTKGVKQIFFLFSLNIPRSVSGGRYMRLIMTFLFLWNTSLSISTKIDSYSLLSWVRSGRFCYMISFTKNIPTPPPDLPDLCVSTKLYPLMLYKSQLLSLSHVSLMPIIEKLNWMFSRHISNDLR